MKNRRTRLNEDADLLPKGTSILQSFWESPTLQELAKSQDGQPVADVRALSGTWPGDKDDGFEAAIDELRRVRGGPCRKPTFYSTRTLFRTL